MGINCRLKCGDVCAQAVRLLAVEQGAGYAVAGCSSQAALEAGCSRHGGQGCSVGVSPGNREEVGRQ